MTDTKKLTVSFSREFDMSEHSGIDNLIYYSLVMYLRKNTTQYDLVNTSIKELIIGCGGNPGVKLNTNKVEKYKLIIDSMINDNLISVGDDISNYKFNDLITIKVNQNKLYVANQEKKYVIVSCYEYDQIVESKTKSKKSTLFAVYVYIISHMYSIGENTSISLPNPGLLCKSLGISVSTYDKAVNDLLNIGMLYKSPHTTIFVNGDFVNAKPMYTKTPGLLTKNFIINYWKRQTGNEYVKVQDK